MPKPIFTKGHQLEKVVQGAPSLAKQLLADVKNKIEAKYSLSSDEQEFLQWGLSRALKGTKDPFGLKTEPIESKTQYYSQTERELFCRQYVQIAKKKLKLGKTKKLKGESAYDIAAKGLAADLGIYKSPHYLKKLDQNANRKWAVASSVYELHDLEDKTLEIALQKAAANHKDKNLTLEEIRQAYLDYREAIHESHMP